MDNKIDLKKIDEIITKYQSNETSLIMILQDVHDLYNYLPQLALKYIAQKLKIPYSRVYSTATFYKAFSLTPKGEKVIKVCLGTACHIRGGEEVAQEFERLLNIKRSETTSDGQFTLETVNCVGACSMAPVVVVNEKYYRAVTPSKVKEIIEGEKK